MSGYSSLALHTLVETVVERRATTPLLCGYRHLDFTFIHVGGHLFVPALPSLTFASLNDFHRPNPATAYLLIFHQTLHASPGLIHSGGPCHVLLLPFSSDWLFGAFTCRLGWLDSKVLRHSLRPVPRPLHLNHTARNNLRTRTPWRLIVLALADRLRHRQRHLHPTVVSGYCALDRRL